MYDNIGIFFLDEILLKKATDVGSNDFTFQKK